MKKRTFITLFITTHLLFVCALIDKQGKILKLSYEKQQYEKKLKLLAAQKQEKTHTLHALKSHQAIKNYATNTLHMEPLFLKNIKKLPLLEIKHNE